MYYIFKSNNRSPKTNMKIQTYPPTNQVEKEAQEEIKILVFGAQIKHGVGEHQTLGDHINQNNRYPN